MPPFLDLQPLRLPAPRALALRPPGSKSITNRALILAALSPPPATPTSLSGLLLADDTRRMLAALASLGYTLRLDEPARTLLLHGRGADLPPGAHTLSCGNSGTTLRFLAAMLSLGSGDYTLDGVPRMRERPIAELVDQLRSLGADISYPLRDGYPPIRIHARGLTGGHARFHDAKSSQYISALLMAAPYAQTPTSIRLEGPITSEPYIAMTTRMMAQFGVAITARDEPAARILDIPLGTYSAPGGTYAIEPDASNASYFWAAGAVIPGLSVTVEGLSAGSLQGDVGVVEVLAEMGAQVTARSDGITVAAPAGGALRGIERDMNAIPDMVQTIAVTALFAQGRTVLKNVWNLRVKETDRLAALEKELAKFGASVETGRDWIAIKPPAREMLAGGALPRVEVETYDDHRMAMAFAVAGLRRGGVRILDPGCTAKTYPEFFDDLRMLYPA
ncbi:MAG TPA: 3-phosphoshikimate 1-carboxyvinyltransferase [Phycisphaerae bacterium]|nr:3-phosphoshikimate 1-carboxyvinyltransferase [Phycisphaerae bacterium]